MKLEKLLRDQLSRAWKDTETRKAFWAEGTDPAKGWKEMLLGCPGQPWRLSRGLSVCWGRMELLGDIAVRGSWTDSLKDQVKEYRPDPVGTGEPVKVVEEGK